MRLAVITCAVYPQNEIEKRLWVFLASARRLGIEPQLYGVGRPWTMYRHIKLDMQLEHLKTISGYSHVLYTDATDAFFMGGLAEIEDKYQELGSPPILTSAHFQLGNVHDEQLQYPNVFDHSKKYCFPCVGGYIAELPAIVEAFEHMLENPNPTSDDCFDWYSNWGKPWFSPALDSGCEIFQVREDYIEVQDGRMMNTYTNSMPCIYHHSGGYTCPVTGKDTELVPWARAVGVIA